MMVHSLRHVLGGPARRRAASIGLGLLLAVSQVPGGSRAASGPYPATSPGYDVSYPNCGAAQSPAGSFAIIGVTGGRAFTTNACLGQEVGTATSSHASVSFYMNLNTAIGSTAAVGNSGPAGTCSKQNKACIDYNYGWWAADAAYKAAPSAPIMWWVDIETGNSWSKSTALNDDVIEGAVDYLQTTAQVPVGIYSTSAMWATIAGGFQPGTLARPDGTHVGTPVPGTWIPATTCSVGSLFTGSAVWVIQGSTSPYDHDTSC